MSFLGWHGVRTWWFRPTRHAGAFALILGAMLLASINYQSNAAWLLVLLVLASGALSAVHGWRNLAAVALGAGETSLIQAGEPTRCTVIVRNPTGRDLVALLVEPPAGGPPILVPVVRAHDRARVAVPLAPQLRGVHRLPALILATQYPLGLFLFRRRIPLIHDLTVYPVPAGSSLTALTTDGAVIIGSRAAPGQQADDFRGVRPWHLGDSPRHIDWKAAARGQGALQTKEWNGGGDGTLWLTWDATTGDPEARLSQLAKWTLEAGQRQLVFGLRLPGAEFAPANSPGQLETCLRALAAFTPGLSSSGRRPVIAGIPA